MRVNSKQPTILALSLNLPLCVCGGCGEQVEVGTDPQLAMQALSLRWTEWMLFSALQK